MLLSARHPGPLGLKRRCVTAPAQQGGSALLSLALECLVHYLSPVHARAFVALMSSCRDIRRELARLIRLPEYGGMGVVAEIAMPGIPGARAGSIARSLHQQLGWCVRACEFDRFANVQDALPHMPFCSELAVDILSIPDPNSLNANPLVEALENVRAVTAGSIATPQSGCDDHRCIWFADLLAKRKLRKLCVLHCLPSTIAAPLVANCGNPTNLMLNLRDTMPRCPMRVDIDVAGLKALCVRGSRKQTTPGLLDAIAGSGLETLELSRVVLSSDPKTKPDDLSLPCTIRHLALGDIAVGLRHLPHGLESLRLEGCRLSHPISELLHANASTLQAVSVAHAWVWYASTRVAGHGSYSSGTSESYSNWLLRNLSCLAALPELESLHLQSETPRYSNPSANPSAMLSRQVTGLTDLSLRYLDLTPPKDTKDPDRVDLPQFLRQNAATLRTLSLEAVALPRWVYLSGLQKLTLSGYEFAPADACDFCPNLRELQLCDLRLGERDWWAFSLADSLRYLTLSYVTPGAYAHQGIAALTQLHRMDISNPRGMSVEDLEAGAGVQALRETSTRLVALHLWANPKQHGIKAKS